MFGLLWTLAAALVAVLLAPASANALALEQVGNFERPTHVTSDPSDPDRLLVVEQAGRIQLVEDGNKTTFLDLNPIVLSPPEPGSVGGQGLFSLALSPDFAADHRLYVAYSGVDNPDTEGEDESGDWHLAEFTATGDTADPASRREILTIDYPAAPFHYAGQLAFGPDGYLYASTGDGGPQGDPDGNAQNLETLFGKIIRIDPEGSSSGEYTVPADNPFTATAGCADGCDEIWSYGLRQPWRFSFDRLTGDLMIGDVGYNSWEEIDFESGPNPGRGDNFGWNCREGGHAGPGDSSPVCADREGTFTEPVFEYPHVGPGQCSITGGYVVRDPALEGVYGRYLYGDFCSGELRSLNLGFPAPDGDRFEGLSVPRVTSFGEDADGRIYVASLNGPVYRLTEPVPPPDDGSPPPDNGIPPPEDSVTPPEDGVPPEENVPPPEDGVPPPEDGSPRPAENGSPPPPDGGPGPGTGPLTLDLSGKKQELKKKIKFFATVTIASTLIAKSKAIKKTTKGLAANQKTKVKAKLKPKKKKKLANRLDKRGKAKVKVKATATTQSGAEATAKVKVKLKD